LEFLLSEPGGTDGAAEEQCVTESVNAAGPKTKDCWRVPLSSVEQTEAAADANSDNPVAIDDADPASPLTQRAVRATLAAAKRRRTGNLFTIVQVGKIPIAFKEIERLTPYNWLNDECINAMGTLMQWRNDRTVVDDPSAPTHYFFSTFFYTKLWHQDQYSYHAVRRWTKNFDALAMDKLFIPVNECNTHWILVVIDKGAGKILLYDSLGGRNRRVAESLRLWLADEAHYYKTPPREWAVEHAWCRAQENSDDCGVFTIENMNYISQGMDLKTMRRSTAYYRRRIAVELLAIRVGGKG